MEGQAGQGRQEEFVGQWMPRQGWLRNGELTAKERRSGDAWPVLTAVYDQCSRGRRARGRWDSETGGNGPQRGSEAWGGTCLISKQKAHRCWPQADLTFLLTPLVLNFE